MADESVQLKTLQTILIIFQSRLLPEDEVSIDHNFIFLLCKFSAKCFAVIAAYEKIGVKVIKTKCRKC